MKLRFLLLAVLVLAAPLPAHARPVSVILYPSGALVTEEETVTSENNVVITLPAGADAESLSFSLSEGTVLESRLRTKHIPSPAMEALQGELESVRVELSRVAAERESVSFERLFWADPPVRSGTEDKKTLDALAKETKARLAELAQRETALNTHERTLEKNIQSLESRMEALGRHNDTVQECHLVINGNGPRTLRWTYTLPKSSWKPSYRITAEEKTGKVRVVMSAVIHQDSGTDWNNVDVTLASTEDMHSVEPPALPVWTEGDERPAMRSMNLMAAKVANTENAVSAQQHSTGLHWSLGPMNIPAEGQLTRQVTSHEFSADFCRIVRPLQDTRAYFTAFLSSEELPLLPSGQGVFYVNGMENARGAFRLNAGQQEIFFGVDQLIRVKTHELAVKTADVPEAVKARQWYWKADIVNDHDSIIEVCAQSAAPILRNAHMRAKIKSRPAADFNEERSCYEWKLEVPAHGTTSITHEVIITAPDNTSSKAAD